MDPTIVWNEARNFPASHPAVAEGILFRLATE
jgi:hypothetical protein